jgi:hypothetical protein
VPGRQRSDVPPPATRGSRAATRATVEVSDGRRFDFNPGDFAVFERGLNSVWTFQGSFRKGFDTCAPG